MTDRPAPAGEAGGETGFIAALVAATFLMGSSFIAGKILLQDGFPPIMLAGWRFVIAAFATLPLVVLDGRGFMPALFPKDARGRDVALVLLIGLLQTAGVIGLLFLAMLTISASTSAILLFTNPIWVALLSRLFLGEALHGARILGLVLGVVGVALAMGIGPDMVSGGGALGGEAIAVASALCWSFSTIINKRARLPFGVWALTFWQMLAGAVMLLIVAYALGEHWPVRTTLAEWSWLLWLAIPASTGSFGLWFLALSKGGATKASSYLFLVPLFTVLLAGLVLKTGLTWVEGFGGVLIGVSLYLVNRQARAGQARSGGMSQGEP
jgi:drug/metabolite transporter (DMT)-like permease